jgi:hypothetical protein
MNDLYWEQGKVNVLHLPICCPSYCVLRHRRSYREIDLESRCMKLIEPRWTARIELMFFSSLSTISRFTGMRFQNRFRVTGKDNDWCLRRWERSEERLGSVIERRKTPLLAFLCAFRLYGCRIVACVYVFVCLCSIRDGMERKFMAWYRHFYLLSFLDLWRHSIEQNGQYAIAWFESDYLSYEWIR